MTLLCIVVSCTHYVFAVTLAVYTIPVFVTIIFSDRKMTRFITFIGVVGIAVSSLVNVLLSTSEDSYLIPESIVALSILLTAHKFSQILIDYQKEKNDALAEGYQEQLRMKELLNYDQKTGIYGSTAFSNSLSRTIDRGSLDNLALAFLDIDDFKYVNDTYGHTAGDEVLMCLAAMIKEICGRDQLPGRFGGICHTVYRGKLGILLLFVGTDSKEISAADIWFFKTKNYRQYRFGHAAAGMGRREDFAEGR